MLVGRVAKILSDALHPKFNKETDTETGRCAYRLNKLDQEYFISSKRGKKMHRFFILLKTDQLNRL